MAMGLEFHIAPTEVAHLFTLKVFAQGSPDLLSASEVLFESAAWAALDIGALSPKLLAPEARMARVREIGKGIYDRLFTAPVKRIWDACLAETVFLELSIRTGADAGGRALDGIPFETLFDGETFLAAGPRSGITRLPLQMARRDALPVLTPPIKMLSVLSSQGVLPYGEPLDAALERHLLLEALDGLSHRGRFALTLEDDVTPSVMAEALEEAFHILHFSLHGAAADEGGGLIMEGADGRPLTVRPEALCRLISKIERHVRLAVLNGCRTTETRHGAGFRETALALLGCGVPAVMAIPLPMSAPAGLLLDGAFYPRLIAGESISQAMSAARRRLLDDADPGVRADAFAPILFAAASVPLKTKPRPAQEDIPVMLQMGFESRLPALATHFVGRRPAYRAVRDALRAPSRRVVVIHGITGIGKTALARQVAKRLKDDFHGVFALDCASSVLSPETILLDLHQFLVGFGIEALGQLIGQALPPERLAHLVGQVLSQLNILMLFDGFEPHLLPGDDYRYLIADADLRFFIGALVSRTTGGSRFLFTSRYRFHLDIEPGGEMEEHCLDALSSPESLALMQRLPALGAAPFADKRRALDAFGGHPYALIAADRHVAHRPLNALLSSADEAIPTRPEHLVIARSCHQISSSALILLQRLAAFKKPVSANASTWVMGEKQDVVAMFFDTLGPENLPEELKEVDPRRLREIIEQMTPEQRIADVDRELNDLIAWGLLIPMADEGDTARVAVHPLVRDFCKDRLEADAWRAHLQDAACYYMNKTKPKAEDEKTQADMAIDFEAVDLLFDAEAYEEGAQKLGELLPQLSRWGFRRWSESLFVRLIPKVSARTQSALIHNLGVLLQGRGEYDLALQYYEQARQIDTKLENQTGLATSLHQIGIIYQLRREHEAARKYHEQAKEIQEALGDGAGVAASLHHLGMICLDRQAYDQALPHFMEAWAIFGATKSPYTAKVVRQLLKLRTIWGEAAFDAAWEAKTGESVPEVLLS